MQLQSSSSCLQGVGTEDESGHLATEEELPVEKETLDPDSPIMLVRGTGTLRDQSIIRKSVYAGIHAVSLRSGKFVLHPMDKGMTRWNMVMLVAVMFVAVVTPVEVCMMEPSLDLLFVLNRVVDLVFLIDFVLQFFTMYPVRSRFGEHYEFRHRKIVHHYLQTWFIVDFLSILPYDLVGLMLETTEFGKLKGVKVLRQMKLVKLFRASKSSRLFRQAEIHLALTYQKLHLIKCFTILIVSSHWIACMWAMTLQLVEEGVGIPRWVDSVTAYEDGVEAKTKDTVWKLYVASCYFAAYTMTSVGYGDIAAKNNVERFVCLCLVFASGLIWTYILGQVCSVVAALDPIEKEFRQTMDDLNFMMRDRGMPPQLQKKLRTFVLSSKEMQRHSRHDLLYEKMSPALQGEVAWKTNHVWIEKVSFLRDIVESGQNKRFCVDIALALEVNTYAQEEIFGEPNVLYILYRGLAGRMIRVYRSGSVWGEDFVLLDQSLQEPVHSMCLTYVEVACLRREAFLEIMQKHQSNLPELYPKVRRFCVCLAVRRGILAEAWNRRAQIDKEYGRNSRTYVGKMRSECWLKGSTVAKQMTARQASIGSMAQSSAEAELQAMRKEVAELREAQLQSNALFEKLSNSLQQILP